MYYVDVSSERERGGEREVSDLLSQSAYNERPIPPLVKEETPLPSSDVEDTDTQAGRSFA
jgi:hypothetical protein